MKSQGNILRTNSFSTLGSSAASSETDECELDSNTSALADFPFKRLGVKTEGSITAIGMDAKSSEGSALVKVSLDA
jgi:hypothetical protein